MTDQTADPTLDRLLRHMAWANAQLIARLAEQPDSALALTAPNNEWSAGRILAHLVNAATGYACRLEQVARTADTPTPTSASELPQMAAHLAALDARLRAQATEPDVLLPHQDPARPHYLRSTVLAQAIHHATEHRAQIAGALATNGNNAVDLDAIDLWEFTDAENGGVRTYS
jgi:uncharacterized damage-inducible protein DinB